MPRIMHGMKTAQETADTFELQCMMETVSGVCKTDSSAGFSDSNYPRVKKPMQRWINHKSEEWGGALS